MYFLKNGLTGTSAMASLTFRCKIQFFLASQMSAVQ